MKQKMTYTAAVFAVATMCATGFAAAEEPTAMKVINTENLLVQENLPVEIATTVPDAELAAAIDLPTVVETAVRQNRGIAISEYKIEEAEGQIREIAAVKNPSLAYQFQGAKQKEKTQFVTMENPMNPGTTITVPVTIDRGFQNALTLTWPLWTGGEAEHGIRAARHARDIAILDLYREEAAVKMNATEGYYKLVEARNFLDIANTAVDNLNLHVDNVRAHYNAGVVAKIDVLSSEVALANAKENQIQAANGVALAEANLNNIMRLPIYTRLVVDDDDLPHRAINLTREQAIAYAMQHRWELNQAELGVLAAEEQLKVAKSGHYPTVALSAGMNWRDTDFPGFENQDWMVGGGVSWKLFDGGATNAKISRQKAALERAKETYEQAREGIQLDVTNAFLQVRSAEERVNAAAQVVEQAQEAFHIARVRYRAGVGINLDVLDAQLQLDQARTNYITALYDYNIGLAKLEQAMGVPAVIRLTPEEAEVLGDRLITADDLLGRN